MKSICYDNFWVVNINRDHYRLIICQGIYFFIINNDSHTQETEERLVGPSDDNIIGSLAQLYFQRPDDLRKLSSHQGCATHQSSIYIG